MMRGAYGGLNHGAAWLGKKSFDGRDPCVSHLSFSPFSTSHTLLCCLLIFDIIVASSRESKDWTSDEDSFQMPAGQGGVGHETLRKKILDVGEKGGGNAVSALMFCCLASKGKVKVFFYTMCVPIEISLSHLALCIICFALQYTKIHFS
jgi:hypothetical protein